MSLEEKLDYVGGDRSMYIRPILRLHIPEIKMSDGPSGCRNWGPSTAYPAGIALAATFDTAQAEKTGSAVGRDCRARGVHVLLAPGVNIQRSPLDGRNFEYLGEDPFLAGKMAASYIRGVQAEGVLATVKHFAANNQEWNRRNISSEVDPRALREMYFPAFERAVREGGVQAVMTAYNLLNGTYCSENAWLIRDVLKGQWGFTGFVMSDWGAVHDGLNAVKGGLDLEMPRGEHMNPDTLSARLADHTLDLSAIDDEVRRILRTLARAGFLDRPQKREDIPLDDPASAQVALDTARRSLVLLKNAGGLLPLDRSRLDRIAVIGPNAQPAVVGGSGSAFVTVAHAVSVLEGITEAARGVPVDYHPGVRQTLAGTPAFEGGAEVSALAHRASVVVVCVGFGQSADTNSARRAFASFWPPEWARKAGLVEAEDSDRPFELPAAQLETIRLAVAANPRTLVVLNAGGGVDLQRFIDRVPAALLAWYPGQEGGRAVAEVLLGDVDPSGKLPVTLARRYADYPSALSYSLDQSGKTPYAEGIWVGYRGFDARSIEPEFPFGFGLSFTRFAYSGLRSAAEPDGSARVEVTVTNTGRRAGDEVVEVYVAPPRQSVPRPPQELKGFARVSLEPGESREVSVSLEPRSFAFWDDRGGTWAVEGGPFEIRVGASSRDIRARQTLEVGSRVLPP